VIGNDLVDLKQAATDSNWQRNGYLEKICTAEEQQHILTAADPSTMLWLMWTMKEAAYKAENRLSGHRFYAPVDFVTCITSAATNGLSGQVCYHGHIFSTRTVLYTGLVHSVACLETSAFAGIHTRYLPNNPGYMAGFKTLQQDYRLEKNKSGIPVVACEKTGQFYAASVSHHGRYLAVTYSDSLLSTG
jgi:phosphopantetheinyl transferase (holo-ACP synthase)